MNLCKDCKHFALDGNATLCNATAISLIDGEARHSVDHCAKARGRNGRCGLEGRLWATEVELVEVVMVDQSGEPQEPPQEPTPKVRKTRTKKEEDKPKEVVDGQAE